MCESTIPLVLDAVLFDPFIKISDTDVIATDLNICKYRQVMPGITLYSCVDLFPKYMGLKHFLVESTISGEIIGNGDVFDDRMFLFSFISKENDISSNKVILIYVKCSVIKECVQYESEHKGDHSFRDALFSSKDSFFFEEYDAKLWSMTKTAIISKNYKNISFAAIKSVLSGQFVINLESLSYMVQPEADNTIDVDGITQPEADKAVDSIVNIEVDATVDVEASTPKPKLQRITTVMQSLLASSGSGISSGKRNRISVNEKQEAAELAAQQAEKARQISIQDKRAKGEHFLLLHNTTDNNYLFVNRERSEKEEIRKR